MPRKDSSISSDWWDYTTLDDDIIGDAAALTPEKMLRLSRAGFKVVMYDTLEDFYLAEALEYITAWKQSTPDNPVRTTIAEINKSIAKLHNGKHVFYLDIGAKFMNADGNIPRDVMGDLEHPTTKGYEIWAEAVKAPLANLLKD